ncbi:MAG: sigma-70 family RNA polymerase sigma factor [Bacteroidales bacterium]|nr:sigma-70 family RNA polymerase sigma factor [Bacteroidales bacterium]MCF8403500.1 sigma-70 family RNA polymerase sigma factor [Bacteroidales bacterium]
MTAVEFNHKLLGLKDNLRYFAYSLTSNHDDADDLIQDTFLKAISNKDKFDPATNLKAWIYTIMKNTFINKYRKDSKVSTIIDNTKDLYYLNTTNNTDSNAPETRYNHSELLKVVNALQDDHRVPFQMHFQGYKYKEIAEQLNLSIGTVKSRIFFSRKKLMEKLKDYQN